jgi:hypothetical protein
MLHRTDDTLPPNPSSPNPPKPLSPKQQLLFGQSSPGSIIGHSSRSRAITGTQVASLPTQGRTPAPNAPPILDTAAAEAAAAKKNIINATGSTTLGAIQQLAAELDDASKVCTVCLPCEPLFALY